MMDGQELLSPIVPTRHRRTRGTQRLREAAADPVTVLVPTVLAPGPDLEKP